MAKWHRSAAQRMQGFGHVRAAAGRPGPFPRRHPTSRPPIVVWSNIHGRSADGLPTRVGLARTMMRSRRPAAPQGQRRSTTAGGRIAGHHPNAALESAATPSSDLCTNAASCLNIAWIGNRGANEALPILSRRSRAQRGRQSIRGRPAEARARRHSGCPCPRLRTLRAVRPGPESRFFHGGGFVLGAVGQEHFPMIRLAAEVGTQLSAVIWVAASAVELGADLP